MAIPRLKWRPLIVGGVHDPELRAALRDASGAYAIRVKRSGSVVYVGESSQGVLWKTLTRHFNAPKTFKAPKPKGGGNAFAVSSPEGYEVAYRVTSRGRRSAEKTDGRALALEGRWIEAFWKAGEPLENLELPAKLVDADDDFDFGANVKANPAPRGVVLPPVNVAADKRAENRTPDLWTGRTKLEEGGKAARKDWRGDAERLAVELADCRRTGAPLALVVPPPPVVMLKAAPPPARPEGYGETDAKGQARMFRGNPAPPAATADAEEFIYWARKMGQNGRPFKHSPDGGRTYELHESGTIPIHGIRGAAASEVADWLIVSMRTAETDARIHGKVSELVGPPPVPPGEWLYSTLLSGAGTVFRKYVDDDGEKIEDVCTTDRAWRAKWIAQLANLGWAFAAEMDAGRADLHQRRTLGVTHEFRVGDRVRWEGHDGKRPLEHTGTIAELLRDNKVRVSPYFTKKRGGKQSLLEQGSFTVAARDLEKLPPIVEKPKKTPRAKKPARSDDTRLRTRAGKYVAECEFCDCPEGCACDGEGCPCGTTKTPKKKGRAPLPAITAGPLVGVAVGVDGRELWKAEAYDYKTLIADADRMAPTARSVSIRADRTSDGTYLGIGNGKLVAQREGGRWMVDGLPDIPQAAYLQRSPAELLRAIEAGPAHSLDHAEVGANERAEIRELAASGYVRELPKRGRWPRRYVVTAAGSHRLGTFDSDSDTFRADAREAGRAARAARPVRAPTPEGYGTEERGRKAGQLRMFNPSGGAPRPSGKLVELGLLTGLGDLSWSLRDAPVLAYDSKGRLFVVYAGKVVRPSASDELREYARTHWGAKGKGDVRNGACAVPPFALVDGAGGTIQYTTRKGADRELTDYVHAWGEGGRGKCTPPTVVAHECGKRGCKWNGAVALVGGNYNVSERGIVG